LVTFFNLLQFRYWLKQNAKKETERMIQTPIPTQNFEMTPLPDGGCSIPGLDQLEAIYQHSGEGFMVGGRFEIIDRLRDPDGNPIESGYSTVYSAIDHGPKGLDAEERNEVVVKIFSEDTPIQRLAADVEQSVHDAFALLHHENIISAIGQGSDYTIDEEPFRYLVLEKANAGVLSDHPGLSQDEKLEIIRQTSEAVAWLGDIGLVHMDIKQTNVGLMRTPDGRMIPKVLDLGSVRPLDDDHENFILPHSGVFDRAIQKLIETGSYAVSEGFLSPEVRDLQIVGVAADSYAIGRMATELFGMRADDIPTGVTIGKLRLVVDNTRVVEPTTSTAIKDDTPEFLAVQCLDLDPSKRPTPHQLAQSLAA
jgi:serine/threonine protein kinase